MPFIQCKGANKYRESLSNGGSRHRESLTNGTNRHTTNTGSEQICSGKTRLSATRSACSDARCRNNCTTKSGVPLRKPALSKGKILILGCQMSLYKKSCTVQRQDLNVGMPDVAIKENLHYPEVRFEYWDARCRHKKKPALSRGKILILGCQLSP